MNILNKPYTENGNYLCTWSMQLVVAKQKDVPGDNFTAKQRYVMNDEMLFGKDSMFHVVPEHQRGGIYFLLDDGWDVPGSFDTSVTKAPFGSLIPDDEKFPNYGSTPAEKLATMVNKVKALGYAGLGLWVSPQMANEPDDATLDDARDYWSERARWSQEAGVKYWKVDWGKHGFNREYIEVMTDCVKEFAPDLYIEHAVAQWAFGGTFGPDDVVAQRMAENFEVSDFFRTYDVCAPFVDDVTLCRLDSLLSNVDLTRIKNGCLGYINVENSPAIAAGLCVNMGVMRGGNNVNAALSWQRMAPPMSVFEADYIKSERRLTDTRYGDAKPDWWTGFNKESFVITAPAVTARSTKLPLVEELEEPPFVMASCHSKTKAYTVATLHRVIDPNTHLIVPADVTIYPDELSAPIGIFGYYKTLTAEFNENIPIDAKIYAQCMLEEDAIDVTDMVKIDGNKLIMDGKLLRKWGREKSSYGFNEDPATAIKIVY